MARILYPSAEAVISTGQKRLLLHVITFFNNRLGSLSSGSVWLSVSDRKMYEIFGPGIVLRTMGCPKGELLWLSPVPQWMQCVLYLRFFVTFFSYPHKSAGILGPT